MGVSACRRIGVSAYRRSGLIETSLWLVTHGGKNVGESAQNHGFSGAQESGHARRKKNTRGTQLRPGFVGQAAYAMLL
jgi:hypothetical protein